MKIFLFIFFFLCLYGCNKPKTVMICGDHVCINKAEAEQYFQDNLSLEVKLINKEKNKNIDLVELNLKKNSQGQQEISIQKKDKTNKKLKILSNKDIVNKKKELKQRKKYQNKNKKEKKNAYKKDNKILKKTKKIQIEKEKVLTIKNAITKTKKEIVDICVIIKKCNIDEISKYLINEGLGKKFPDITLKE